MAALTNAQIQEIKNRLGYGNLTALALPYIETALVFETVVQQNLDDFGSNYILTIILPALQAIDTQIAAEITRFQAQELVGEVILDAPGRMREHLKLVEAQDFWIGRLSETVRVARAPKRSSTSSEVY